MTVVANLLQRLLERQQVTYDFNQISFHAYALLVWLNIFSQIRFVHNITSLLSSSSSVPVSCPTVCCQSAAAALLWVIPLKQNIFDKMTPQSLPA